MAEQPATLFVWRHPKPVGATGRCIGRTDLPVDARRAKRLAHRIRRHARLHRLPCEVHTSPLRRSADVGRWLARWGWSHRIDAALSELDFGVWDGLTWDAIGESAVAGWCAEFADFAAHGGESVAQLFDRCAKWLAAPNASAVRCVVGHAGWINAARLQGLAHGTPPVAADWPVPVGYGEFVALSAPFSP